jgi:hypothetical protein
MIFFLILVVWSVVSVFKPTITCGRFMQATDHHAGWYMLSSCQFQLFPIGSLRIKIEKIAGFDGCVFKFVMLCFVE